MDDSQIAKLVEEKVAQELDRRAQAKKMAIIVSKGALDEAYPPLILASTAAAMDLETAVFFTFYGLDVINKKKNQHLKVAPVGNPAMPVPMPTIFGILPGMTMAATAMMKSWMAKQNVPSITELLQACQESEVRLIACQMTMDVMGIKKEDLIDGLEFAGAATFMDFAADSQVNLFI